MEAFEQLVIDRRSANNSIEGIEITLQKLDEIFGLAKLAPSAFNLQHPPRTYSKKIYFSKIRYVIFVE